MSVPTLEKKHHKWFLHFAFEEDVKLKNTKDKILATGLGINTDATCPVMKKDGTILAKKFINFASGKDQINHTLNKIKGVSQKYGSHNTTKLWRAAKFRNEELARKIAKAISDYARLAYDGRELEKSISAKNWSLIQAKVPECVKRTQCTYSTFAEILKAA